MDTVEYVRLRPEQLRARREANATAYLGLGILEWHGLHNPMGLDGVKAHAVCCYLAQRLGGVAMPPQFWGDYRREIAEIEFDPAVNAWIDPSFGDHTHEICRLEGIDKAEYLADAERCRQAGGWRLWQELMVRTLFEIQTLGFKRIVVMPGHYPLIRPLEQAMEIYRNQGGQSRLMLLKDHMVFPGGYEGDHAAKFETSLLMALEPQLVDLTRLDPNLSQPNVGVMGDDPRTEASVEYGHKILDRFIALTQAFLDEDKDS